MRPRMFLRLTHLVLAIGVLFGATIAPLSSVAFADHTPLPASVNLAGDLQSEATGGPHQPLGHRRG
ncbi:hypothetical protein [Chloroflexus sp.]|uniref:hypothetical protein n=1 Tax=Chloroflexus sp. TaxID=1904827 RepID=UPI00404B5769